MRFGKVVSYALTVVTSSQCLRLRRICRARGS